MYIYHDEIEIEDMEYDEDQEMYFYPCPCGNRFQISKEDLENGEDVATCPSCSLIIKVIYDPKPTMAHNYNKTGISPPETDANEREPTTKADRKKTRKPTHPWRPIRGVKRKQKQEDTFIESRRVKDSHEAGSYNAHGIAEIPAHTSTQELTVGTTNSETKTKVDAPKEPIGNAVIASDKDKETVEGETEPNQHKNTGGLEAARERVVSDVAMVTGTRNVEEMQENLLRRVLQYKKMMLLRSPEVMAFLTRAQSSQRCSESSTTPNK